MTEYDNTDRGALFKNDKKNPNWIFRKLNYNYNPPAVKKQKPVE